MSNDWDEDRAPEGTPRCRVCERPAEGDLCADCEWHSGVEE